MLISAKVGMDRSTYSNYKEARQGFYESTISSEWQFLAGQMAEQLLPEYGDESLNCVFDTKKVKALQEDRTSMVDRAVKLYQSGIAKLNEARREANLDAMDEGDLLKAPQLPLQNDPSNADPKNVIEDDRTPEELAKAKEEVTAFRKFAKARIKEGKQSILASFEFKYITLDEQTKLLNEFSVKADNDLLVLAEALNKYALAVNNG
jgi:hypothetical protein